MSKKRKKTLSKKDKALIKKMMFENLKNYDIQPEKLANDAIKIFKAINRA
ncbi:hypothetical protein MIS33_07630 [Wielerella bovis]|nr:hypothetical protein [Wielerella bovis]ULJ64032.1 hypothetical protein MIS33_07630 [Wielerella bovis]